MACIIKNDRKFCSKMFSEEVFFVKTKRCCGLTDKSSNWQHMELLQSKFKTGERLIFQHLHVSQCRTSSTIQKKVLAYKHKLKIK